MIVRVNSKITVRDDENKIIRAEGYAFMCNPEFESVEVMKEKLVKGADVFVDTLKSLESGNTL